MNEVVKERMSLAVTDLDATLVSEILQSMRRSMIKEYGRFRVTREEFDYVFERDMHEFIHASVNEYYGEFAEQLRVPDDAESWEAEYARQYL